MANRYLIAAGTRSGYVEHAELPEAHRDVERIVDLFTSMGYQRVLTEVSLNPQAGDFEDALAEWIEHVELAADDVVVLYYAGHGDRPIAGAYRLACAGSVAARPRSWLSLENLNSVLGASPVRNVLFIIDACNAAAGAGEITSLADDFAAARPRNDPLGSGTWVLASARHRDLAGDGAFVVELTSACHAGDGPSQRFLSPAKLTDKVNSAFAEAGRRQRVSCSHADLTAQAPFFSNRFFDPSAEIGRFGNQVGGEAVDVASHFEPRGRGVEHVHDVGSYFTGRAHALDVLRAHLSGPGGRSPLGVTGAPGSGKSAVLGRLVLDGQVMESAHRINVSVNARHQTLDALINRLAAAADIQATNPSELLAGLAGRAQPFRVIVDSLDEAGTAGDKAEARRIAFDLLRPLGSVPCVRLVVGTRPELLLHLGGQVPIVDLDDNEYADDTSTADYVEQILCDAGAPYEDAPVTARRIAEAVARRAKRCFLIARMTASALLRGEQVDVGVPGWEERLPSDVAGAFEAYLERIPPERRAASIILLTTLAFAEGHGLPRAGMWATIATRISGKQMTEADIDALLDEDSSYLTMVDALGIKYYRLYHQELTDHLKRRALRNRDLRDIQACFVQTLVGLPPPRPEGGTQDWSRAHPYIRFHLATHAASAGLIDDLIEDPAYVLSADITRLLRAVRHSERNAMLAMVIERCAGMLSKSDEVDRAAQLAFVAETHGARGFAQRALALSVTTDCLWVEHREITPHRIIGQHDASTYSKGSISGDWTLDHVTTAQERVLVLAIPPSSMHAHVWTLDDPSAAAILPHGAPITGGAILPDDRERSLAVTLDRSGCLRTWDLEDQTLVVETRDSGFEAILDTGRLSNGTPTVVCGDSKRLAVWDPHAEESLVEVRCAKDKPSQNATARLVRHGNEGMWLLVADPALGSVTVHPIELRTPSVTLIEDLEEPSILECIHLTDGCSIAAIGDKDRNRVTLLDATTGKSIRESALRFSPEGGKFVGDSQSDCAFVIPAGGALHVLPVASDRHPSQAPFRSDVFFSVLPLPWNANMYGATSGFSGEVQLVDIQTGRLVGRPLFGHESAVCAMLLLPSHTPGVLRILAVGNDGTARLWERNLSSNDASLNHKRADDINHPTTEADSVHHWAARGRQVIASSLDTIRLISSAVLDADGEIEAISDERKMNGASHTTREWVEDKDGSVHFFSFGDLTRITGDTTYRAIDKWWRLTIDGALTELASNRQGTECEILHVIPPTRAHPKVRVLAMDSERQVHLMGEFESHPCATPPWGDIPELPHKSSTAFSSPNGLVMLMACSPEGRSGFPDKGYLWEASSGEPCHKNPVELPYGTSALVPHHTTEGTRHIAIPTETGELSVFDLVGGRLHIVSRLDDASDIRKAHPEIYGRAALQWALLPSGRPMLLYVDFMQQKSGLRSVGIWDPEFHDADRLRLPMLCSRLLWTGNAPSGEALAAVRDECGVSLCHLPSCEVVWNAPIPALINDVAVLPNLDLAIATQQGVVLLRPRLSAAWRKRLGIS
ncbi:caspase family protein [Streptomyces sp. NPDC001675]